MVQKVGESVQEKNFIHVKTEVRIAEITFIEVCSLWIEIQDFNTLFNFHTLLLNEGTSSSENILKFPSKSEGNDLIFWF